MQGELCGLGAYYSYDLCHLKFDYKGNVAFLWLVMWQHNYKKVCIHWKPRVVMMPTLSSLVETQVMSGKLWLRFHHWWQSWHHEPQWLTRVNSECYSTKSKVNCPCDVICRHKTWSGLIQMMTCCLIAPSHYLKQYWLIIAKVLKHSPKCNFKGNAQNTYPWYEFENYWFQYMQSHLQGPMS